MSERTNMRFSYAHQVQPPDFSLILGGINTDLSVTNTNHVYGADLDFGKTITFEFGIRHAFSDDFVLDFSAYNRDAQSNPAGRLVSMYDPLKDQNQDIRMMTNADFGNYRGFDVRLDKRIGSLFNGTLAYSFSDAKNTGSDPFTYINFGSRIVNQISGGNDPPPSAFLPTTYTRPHNLAGSFSVTFPGDWHEGSTMGAILQNVGHLRHLPDGQRHRLHPLPGRDRQRERALRAGLRPRVRGRRERLAAAVVRNSRPPRHQGLPVRRHGPDGLPRRPERLQPPEHHDRLRGNQRCRENGPQCDRLGRRLGRLRERGHRLRRARGGRQHELPSRPAGAANWLTQDGDAAAPNCVYLIRAEERFGDGDGVFTLAEQRRASDARSTRTAAANFTAWPRLRLGLELNF